MKKVLLLPLSLTLLLASCIDVFDTSPLDRIVEETVWTEESLMRAYITNLYSDFPWTAELPNRDVQLAGAGGELQYAFSGSGAPPVPTVTNDAAGFFDYGYIRDLNVFLEELEEARIPEASKDAMRGEVRAIRAISYFEKQKRYGGVPLVDVALDAFDVEGIEEQYLRRATEEEVADFIDQELAAAVELLPASPDISNTGQLNRWSVLGYKARANLWAASVASFPAPLADQSDLIGIPAARAAEFYGKAAAAADAVIQNGPYALHTALLPDHAENYRAIFLSDGNSEVMLERHYDGVNLRNTFSYNNVMHLWSAGQGGSHVTYDLLIGFERLDGTVAEPEFGAQNRYADGIEPWLDHDPRVRAMAFLQGMEYGGRPLEIWEAIDPSPAGAADPSALLSDNAREHNGVRQVGREGGRRAEGVWLSNSGLHTRKYLIETAPGSQLTGDEAAPSMKDMRLAEMYLIKAEAEFELGNLGPASEALNATRQRAGLPPVEDVGGITRERVRTERMSELALETRRYWDLRRWRIAEDELHGRQFRGLRTIYHFEEDSFYFLPSTSSGEGSEDVTRQFLAHHYYNPMTNGRRENNPRLVENPGY